MNNAQVIAVSKSRNHTMKKWNTGSINLLKALGVEGDAHMGKTVKHRSRVAKDPSQPNLRQVHLIDSELHRELQGKGFAIKPGEMGENITTAGLDLLSLPEHTILKIGQDAEVKITGLRNPCTQLDGLHKGLMKAVLGKDKNGNLIRKAGVMGIVLEGGVVRVGDEIELIYPKEQHVKLKRV